MLEVNSIYLYRNKKQIFKNFNLNLKEKEIILIAGDNGVGKTSLLDTISGLINPKTGSIKINGKEINEIGEFRKNYFSYIPHKNCLKENLSINENLLSWLKLLNIEINELSSSRVRMYNISGALILDRSFTGKTHIDMSSYTIGNYLINIDNKNGFSSKKVTIY